MGVNHGRVRPDGRRELRATARHNLPAAHAEACRRMRVMHEKWPETDWRVTLRYEHHPVVHRWMVWALYVHWTPSG